MGALAAVIPAAGMFMGIKSQRRARQSAERQAAEQRAYMGQQQAQIQKESTRLNTEIAKQQKRLQAGQIRANRSRVRGGIFGEAEPTNQNTSATLG